MTPPPTEAEKRLARECAGRLSMDVIYAEARDRHLNDATQSGFEHHLLQVVGEHSALLASRKTSEAAAAFADSEPFISSDHRSGGSFGAARADQCKLLAGAYRSGEHLERKA